MKSWHRNLNKSLPSQNILQSLKTKIDALYIKYVQNFPSLLHTQNTYKYKHKLILTWAQFFLISASKHFFCCSEKNKPKDSKKKEEPSSVFQRQRVDLLLGELVKKFPPKFATPAQPEQKGK